MIISTDDRTANDWCVYMPFWVIVIIMVFKALKNIWIFYFEETLVKLWYQTLLKEDDCVFMSIAYETLVFLTQLPLMWRINFEESFSWFLIKMWILIPNHLRIIDLSRKHKSINLVTMISSNSLSSFRFQFNLILFYKSVLLNHYELILIILFTDNIHSLLTIYTRLFNLINLVRSFCLCYSFEHKSVSFLNCFNWYQPFLFLLQHLNIQLVVHLQLFLL